MSAAIALLVCLSTQAAQPEPASVVYYSPGVFERVVRVRERQGYRLVRTEGWVTSPYCSDIGKTLWLSVGGKRVHLTVADCSQTRDRARHIRRGQREVDYRTAVRLGMVKYGRVRGLVWPE